MAQQINISITIDSKEIKPFTSLTINQLLFDHHSFELRFNHDVIEASKSLNISKSKDFLGKVITININTLKGENQDHVFKGIVTNIGFANNFESTGDLIFSGHSCSIVLETEETNASFTDSPLNKIVKDVANGISSNILNLQINPAKKNPIPFVVQYRESNFNFIRRLASEYGEWFFYDGTKLVFGTPAQNETLNLLYPHDVTDYNLQIKAKHVNFQEISYLSKDNKKVTKDTSAFQTQGLDSLGKAAFNSSQQLFNTKSNTLSKRKFLESSELDESIKSGMSNIASDLVLLKISSDCPQIKIGAVIKFSAKVPPENNIVDYGKFIVVSANHAMDGLGNYRNEFEAIPSSLIVPPNPYVNKPNAEAQLAVVIDNKDPDNLGRVKVQMLWQQDSEYTPWIRVLTPHSGMRNGDKKNRGIFFTPEIDDYVMIGFTQNDPDRPFVLGSIPHGKAINSSKNTNNQTKAIRTRTGSTIYFHDKENSKESEIRIETDKNNYLSILVNSGDGTVKLFSNKEIIINAKDSITVKSGSTINVKSKNITVEASDTIKLNATNNIELSAKEIKLEANNSIEAKATSSAKIESMKVEIAGSTTTKVSAGAKLDLEGGAMANLKAGLIKIN